MVRIKTHEQIKFKVSPKLYEPTKEERQSHEATHCPIRAWCEVCVKAWSFDGKDTEQHGNVEHFLVIEFDYAFATDTPGDPNRKILMMVATDAIHGSISAVVAEKGWTGWLCDAEFLKIHWSIGIGEGRIEMWPGAKHFWCSKHFDQAISMQS